MPEINNPIERFPNAFLAAHLSSLVSVIHELSKDLFREAGIHVDPKCVSVLMAIAENRNASASDIAQSLGISHQLVTQRIKKLERSGHVTCSTDREDARRRITSATRSGRAEIKRIEPVLARLEEQFTDLSEQIDIDLPGAVLEARSMIAGTRQPH